MACAFSQNYVLVDKDGALQQSLRKLKTLKPTSLLAIDCEGVNLSREGELTIVTVATKEKAYIFDVVKLKQAVFDEGLREILEDKSREKLMFDCRQDSDSLWHQYRVKLDGVLDVQLLEVMHRRENSKNPIKVTGYKRRSTRVDEVENIYGFSRCIELYVKDEDALKVKEEGKELIKTCKELWKRRPITEPLLRYCAVDTLQIFKLYNKVKSNNDEELSRLRVASERYVDMYRGKTKRNFDDFETNAYLPLDIIPEKGAPTFPCATTQCVECERLFPREEFSKTQLRNREQRCRVCKEVKRRLDVKANREENWRRAYEDEMEYGYVDDDDYFGYYGESDYW